MHWIFTNLVLKVAGFRNQPVWGGPGIFYPEPAPAPGKREHNFEIFKTDYEVRID